MFVNIFSIMSYENEKFICFRDTDTFVIFRTYYKHGESDVIFCPNWKSLYEKMMDELNNIKISCEEVKLSDELFSSSNKIIEMAKYDPEYNGDMPFNNICLLIKEAPYLPRIKLIEYVVKESSNRFGHQGYQIHQDWRWKVVIRGEILTQEQF